VQAKFFAHPTEEIGQREQRRCVGTTSEGQCVCAGKRFEEEGVLRDVAREDFTGQGAITEAAHERVRERRGRQVAVVGP
jgi:hypothetical protein